MKDQVRDGVLRSFERLAKEDCYLFECPIEEHSQYDARKLHEVCVNHRLANHLEDELRPIWGDRDKMFVDIEFNREGIDFKNVRIAGQDKKVRPDIIIHNRQTGADKFNFLVVECKKNGASKRQIEEDQQKIIALMDDDKYAYCFGLQVVYGSKSIKGKLFFRGETGVESGPIEYSLQEHGSGSVNATPSPSPDAQH